MSVKLEKVLEKLSRKMFLQEDSIFIAYDDNQVYPIGCGQTISQRSVVYAMTEALQVTPKSRVLEIGTGSGYQCAVLSYMCRWVYTVERHDALQEVAKQTLLDLKRYNISYLQGDGTVGWKEQAPFNHVIVTACAQEFPHLLFEQLMIGGRMVFPLDEGTQGHNLYVIEKKSSKDYSYEKLMEARFVPLVSNEVPEENSFGISPLEEKVLQTSVKAYEVRSTDKGFYDDF